MLAEHLLTPKAPRRGVSLVQSILESDRIEDADGYQAYLAAAGFAPARFTDHAEQTVVATTRAFRSERYRNRSRVARK